MASRTRLVVRLCIEAAVAIATASTTAAWIALAVEAAATAAMRKIKGSRYGCLIVKSGQTMGHDTGEAFS